MALSIDIANRFGFLILGLTNNFAYVIMLSAAYDLIKKSENQQPSTAVNNGPTLPSNVLEMNVGNNTIQTTNYIAQQNNSSYCNQHSTSAILLADTIPSLTTKLIYPLVLVGIPIAYKASATALLSAISFLMTGFASKQVIIYAGVACASFSSGLGESTFLSNSPLYGDVALSGWSMGTGAAGLVGAMAYALLRMIIDIEWIMIIMLIVPISMMYAYFFMVQPVGINSDSTQQRSEAVANLSIVSNQHSDHIAQNEPIESSIARQRSYGANGSQQIEASGDRNLIGFDKEFDVRTKIEYLPTLSKYFMPLLLVYFAEYFINQGLFELIYYPEIGFLDHAAQYRWFQVSYQLGVMLSRSSLDLFRIKQLWTMSILQAVNALLFLAHVSKLIHIPSFYIIVALIIYEGLLGGFTYANTFYRMKKELPSSRHEFAISTVTIADTLGIVIAGAVAMQAYNALCALYT